jgi:hypothetical protein
MLVWLVIWLLSGQALIGMLRIVGAAADFNRAKRALFRLLIRPSNPAPGDKVSM